MAILKVGRNWSGDSFTAVMVGPGERAPPGFKILGKPEETEAAALQHAVTYFQAAVIAKGVGGGRG